eukprot:221969-Pyramimonas_sp.AAC.1
MPPNLDCRGVRSKHQDTEWKGQNAKLEQKSNAIRWRSLPPPGPRKENAEEGRGSRLRRTT